MGENGKWSHFPAKVEDAPDVLRGRLMTNHVVVLTGVKMEHTFPGRTKVTADTALVGGEVPDNLLFESIEFQVGGLTELATVRPLGAPSRRNAPRKSASRDPATRRDGTNNHHGSGPRLGRKTQVSPLARSMNGTAAGAISRTAARPPTASRKASVAAFAPSTTWPPLSMTTPSVSSRKERQRPPACGDAS